MGVDFIEDGIRRPVQHMVICLMDDKAIKEAVHASIARTILDGLDTEARDVSCPGCNGHGTRSAMSGAHLPYYAVCSDCMGRGRVEPEVASEIKKRHKDWLDRQSR